MSYRFTHALAWLVVLFGTPATAGSWEVVAAGDGHGEKLTFAVDPTRSYVFECGSDAVIVTQTGVTDLLDIRGNGKIGDAPGSVMPEGAAVMALYTGKGDPNFLPTQAAPNIVKGWDLTLRFAKNDKALKALAKADIISLFTTGYTAAVPMDADGHAKLAGFLARCRPNS
jgi:hypothetical protein